MDFCPKCDSVLYLSTSKEEGKIKLLNICRNCGYKSLNENNCCVYNHNFEMDAANNTYNNLNNKYLIKDPTLPRLSNIDCINNNCLTRTPNSILVYNNDNLDQVNFLATISKLIGIDPETVQMEEVSINNNNLFDYGEIHFNQRFFTYNELIKPIILYKFTNDISKLKPYLSVGNISENKYFKECIKDGKDNLDSIPYISFIEKQIVFIKYDPKNMRYMYICSTCGTTWKNIT